MTDVGIPGGVFSLPRASFPGRDGEAVAPVPARAGTATTKAFAAVVAPLATLLVLNIADVMTTHRILGMGGRELNPVAGWLLANGMLLAAKIALVVIAGALAVAAGARRWVVPALWGMAAFYGSIIAFHMTQLALR